MKKTVIFAILALFTLQGTLQAQYSQYYYHRTGDTIEHDSPAYYHCWWEWLYHYHTKRLLFFLSPGSTVDTNTIRLQQFYSPDTLKIIGIAGMRPRSLFPGDTTEKVYLYVCGDDPYPVLARVDRQWCHDLHRIIHLKYTGSNPNVGNDVIPSSERITPCCYNLQVDDYYGVYEYYFDSAIFVADTFYVGSSAVPYRYHVLDYPGYSYEEDCEGRSCEGNMYAYIGKSEYNGHLWTKGRFPQVDLVWPIIEIDTTVPPDFVCLPLEDLHVTALDTFAATVAWSDVSAQTTEVQVRYGPTATPGSNWRTLTVAGGSRSTTLSLPREEFADYAVMVRPLCDSLKTSAAWSDTVFFSLPRDTVGILSSHAAGFTLQPNPATGSVTLTLAESSLPADVEVVDLSGRTVLAWRATSPTLTLPLDGLPAGTYLVRAAGHTRRLVKN